MDPDKLALFKQEVERLLNKMSIDADCNTPDFILAEYVGESLKAYVNIKKLTDNFK